MSVQWTIKHRVNTGRHSDDLYVNETLPAQVNSMDHKAQSKHRTTLL